MSSLADVALIPRMLRPDERGWFLKVIDGTEPHLPPFTGEVYVTLATPGQARGNHYHRLAAEWFTVIGGTAAVILADPATGERRALELTAAAPVTLYIPAGIGHVFVNPPDAREPLLLIAYADRLYDPADTIPMDVALTR